MSNKRKAKEAFGTPKGHVSAFAAARARSTQKPIPVVAEKPEVERHASDGSSEALAASVGAHPYDGHDDESDASSTSPAGEQDGTLLAPPPAPAATRLLSSFKLHEGNLLRDHPSVLELKLRPEGTAAFAGVYDLSVQAGAVRVYGATLRPESGTQRVYALTAHAIPQIIAHQQDAIIVIRHVRLCIGKLERLSPLFKNLRVEDDRHGRSFGLIEGETSLAPLEVGRAIRSVISVVGVEAEQDRSRVRVLAAGAKSSGKSTFNRLCCNSLVAKPDRKCYYLDLDLGQPEFGPPGQISLIEVTRLVAGPPYTHIASQGSKAYRLLRSHALAATTFKDDPDHYLACVKDLLNAFERARHTSTAPLVVNTCGWVAGVGAQVLLELVSIIKPTHLIWHGTAEEPIYQSLQAATVAETVLLPRQPVRPPMRSPAELRAMQTMSYFHRRAIAHASLSETWTGKPINTHRPWHASYAGPNSGIHAIASYNQTVAPEFLAEVLDGAIVAIVAIEPEHLDHALDRATIEPSTDEDTTVIRTSAENLPYLRPSPSGLPTPLNPRYSSCAGLALVRAIDTTKQGLQLVAPLPESEIAELESKKVVLVFGGFDAPEWAYLEGLHAGEADGTEVEEGGKEAPWVKVGNGERRKAIEGAVWRLRHPPLSGK